MAEPWARARSSTAATPSARKLPCRVRQVRDRPGQLRQHDHPRLPAAEQRLTPGQTTTRPARGLGPSREPVAAEPGRLPPAPSTRNVRKSKDVRVVLPEMS
jgi:hypothetical protein